jgi:hypothetical protein
MGISGGRFRGNAEVDLWVPQKARILLNISATVSSPRLSLLGLILKKVPRDLLH